jgi:hypothetical protein
MPKNTQHSRQKAAKSLADTTLKQKSIQFKLAKMATSAQAWPHSKPQQPA